MPLGKERLANQVVTGLFWTACGKGTVAVLQLGALVILARLVSPHDFGIVGAAAIIVGFSEIITELGLGAAIVQRENLEERHVATAFTTSLLLGCSAGLLIYFLSPLIAAFFFSAQVEGVLRVLCWIFPIRSLATLGEALAQRQMRFRFLAATDIVSFGLGYLFFGAGLAFLDYGVWALVAASLAATAIKSGMFLICFPPNSLMPHRKAFSELLYFGGGHTAARISNFLALQGDNLVVGRTLGLHSLGIYGRAYQVMSTPASMFGQILDRVLFPSMAQIQNQKERLSAVYLRGVSLIALIMLPTSVVGIILAPELVVILLGDNWSEVILPLRILMIGLLMRTSYKLSDSLARATGAVYRRAWRQAVYAAMVVGGAWLGHFWGVVGVAVGVLGAVTLNFLLMAQISLKLIGRGWRDFLAAHREALIVGASVALTIYPLVRFGREINISPAALLMASSAVLILLAALFVRFAPRFFLGVEGEWLIEMLRRYPAVRIQPLRSKGKEQTTKQYGVKDASIENA